MITYHHRVESSITNNLVGGWATPLKNMSSSIGMILIYGKIKHVPNHQPVIDDIDMILMILMNNYDYLPS